MKLDNSADPVSYLFHSNEMVRILRYLLANDSSSHTVSEIEQVVGVAKKDIRSNIKHLSRSGVIVERKRKAGSAYQINNDSELVTPLRNLIGFDFRGHAKEIAKSFRKIGKTKHVIATGRIANNSHAEVDLVVVADVIDEKKLAKLLKNVGYKCGYDVRYMLFDTNEFNYRREMNDRLMRNIFDFSYFFVVGSDK